MASRRRPPFVVLFREFFSQFFTSETVSSDDQLRQTLVWVVVFLFLPGVMLMVQLLFEYAGVVIRAIKLQQFDRLDDTLEWIAFLYITYSMVTVGFIAVMAWDGLTFDRRDAGNRLEKITPGASSRHGILFLVRTGSGVTT